VWGIKFVPDQTPEIMSPGQVLAARHASCTGLSIFLVLACRAVGIPARVAGVQRGRCHARGSVYTSATTTQRCSCSAALFIGRTQPCVGPP
jgi:transglutaminase-like putative cysteine protease